jgi:putative molybdopterin biosynthesis protein
MSRKIFRFLKTVDEVWEIINKNYLIKPKGEKIKIDYTLGRTSFENIYSPIDVPGFDRSSMDGFAVIAQDTFGVDETTPVELKLIGKIEAGEKSELSLIKGECIEISTGAPIPKGANAVVMVEYTIKKNNSIKIFKPITMGENIQATGSDIMRGELIVRKNQLITSREIGIISATGLNEMTVYRQPKIAVLSTGNEIIELGQDLDYGKIYDINSHTIIAAIREVGGEPTHLGIIKDNKEQIKEVISNALGKYDIILTSGSTSAGIGDVMYNLFNELGKPGVLVHGIAIKPGKPTIIALIEETLIIGLPGYPTSALSIFDVFVKPIITRLSGRIKDKSEKIKATISQKIVRKGGRKELLPISIIKTEKGYALYPILKGSGAISTLAEADGYIELSEKTSIIEEGEEVIVNLYPKVIPANLIFIGSHCIGLDLLIELLKAKYESVIIKVINVGSLGGINAIKRGEADIAGIHLVDEKTGKYNIPILKKENLADKVKLIRGYNRLQGLIIPKGNPKKIMNFNDIIEKRLYIINRNKGSGTRILLDKLINEIIKGKDLKFKDIIENIPGYNVEAKTHSAVAAAVKYNKADVGIGIKTIADFYDLDFIPLTEEKYDFIILNSRLNKPEIKWFIELLRDNIFQTRLQEKLNGYIATSKTGQIIN